MSIDIIKLISEFSHKNITLPYALDILRGANTKNIRDAGHNNLSTYNSCNQLNKIDLERLICRLILDGYLQQEIVTHQQQSFETTAAYLRLGPKAHIILSNKMMDNIELIIRTEQSNIINDDKRKQQTPIEQLNEQCLNEIKKELKLIFGNTSHAMIIPERAIKEMVKLMPYVSS
jgi:superfamily II DNA helicase RecQ